MTVFVLHPVKDDLTAALSFGELKYLHTSYIFPDQLEPRGSWGQGFRTFGLPVSWYAKMEEHARAFEPEKDFLLMVGDHLQLLAFAALLAAWNEVFAVLRYDRDSGQYLPIDVCTAEINGHA